MSTGGSAMYYGANFQADVAALFAIASMAEDTSAIPQDVVQPQTAQLPPSRIGSEQNWPTDDIAVWFRSPGRWWLQSKVGLQYSASADSDFSSVFNQFVAQWKHGRARDNGTPFISDDRLWLVLGDHASSPLRIDLCDILNAIATIGSDDPLISATNGEARLERALERLRLHIGRALASLDPPIEANDENVAVVARYMRVWATNQETVQQVSRTLLGAHVVRDDAQVAAAYAIIQQHFSDAGQHRLMHDTNHLRALLRNRGIALKEPRSVAGDVERLRSDTRATLTAERRSIRTREGMLRIERAILPEALDAIRYGDLVITGEAGAGKSDVIIQAAQALEATGVPVVYLDASLPHMDDPRNTLRLEERLEVVLERWGVVHDAAYLFIDGFDSTRVGPALDVLIRVIRRLRVHERTWHIVIASREYDLLHGAGMLADLFSFDPDQPIRPERRDERFAKYAHIVVPRLSQEEINAVSTASASLNAIVASASDDLLEVLTNPFNLSIAANLASGAETPDLSAVHSQIELLDLWWNQRVLSGARHLEKQQVIRDVARAMVQSRALRLPTASMPAAVASEDLLSNSVFAVTGPRQEDLGFTHAIVFDYAVDRLLFAAEGEISVLLGADPDAFLFVLPALRMCFDGLWTRDRLRFYREMFRLVDLDDQRQTLLMIVARVIFERFTSLEDLLPMLNHESPRVESVVRFLVRTLIYERERGHAITANERPKWVALATELSSRLPRFEHDTLLILGELLEHAA